MQDKRKEVESKKIKHLKKVAENRKKKGKEALKKAEKLVVQGLAVKESQQKTTKTYVREFEYINKITRDNLSAKNLIKLNDKLKETL